MQSFALPENRYQMNLPLLKNFDYRRLDEEMSAAEKKAENPFSDATLIEMQPNASKLRNLRASILQTLEKEHFFWDCPVPPQSKGADLYRWDLPASNFEEESAINQVHLKVYTFHSERSKLDARQIKDVWNTRTFQVESEIPDLPHKWELSPWLINSWQEKRRFLRGTVAFCWSLLFALLNVLNPCSDRVIRKGCLAAMARPNLFNVLVSIWGTVLNLFDFFFGVRFRVLKRDYRDSINQNVVKKQYLKIKAEESRLPETCALLEYLLVPEQTQYDMTNAAEKAKFEKKSKKVQALQKRLLDASQQFDKDFEQKLTDALNKEDFEEEELAMIRSDFETKRQEMLCEFLEQHKDKFDNSHLLDLLIRKLRCHHRFQAAESRLNAEKTRLEKEEFEAVKAQFPIYSMIDYKFQKLVRRNLQTKVEFAEEKTFFDLSAQLSEADRPEEVLLARHFRAFQQEKERLFDRELREYKPHNLSPVQTLPLKVRRYPCCYVIENTSTPDQSNFYLHKHKTIKVCSNFPFYRLAYGVLGYLIDVHNTCYHLARWAWDGPLGLKVLLLCSDFYRDEHINYNTGEYLRTKGYRVRPILRKFTAVLKGMSIDRRRFEESPDTGLFGKNFARFCMYLEFALIRFLFVGVVLILLVNPALILLNLAITLALLATAFAWVLAFNLLLLFWKIVIFDYNLAMGRYGFLRKSKDPNIFESRQLILLYSYGFLPLLKHAIDLIFQVGVQAALVVCVIVLAPVLSVVLLLGGVLLFVLKNIWDWAILNLVIKCCARVPSSNTSYAVRISGPGVSRDFYNSLESKHLSLLVIAHLERCELDQIQKELTTILDSPHLYIKKQYQTLFKNFMDSHASNPYLRRSFDNLAFLKQSLEHHIAKRKKRLPQIATGKHTVRFTEEDLERNQVIVQGILSEKVEEKNMDRYIWTKYNLRKGLFKRLTRKVLRDVLTDQALEAVEKVDQVQRVHYSKNSLNEYVTKVVNHEDQSFNQKRKKRLQLIRTLRARSKKSPTVYTTLSSLVHFFSKASYEYTHPFRYYPTPNKAIKDWKAEAEERAKASAESNV